jgi:hypothetical protein
MINLASMIWLILASKGDLGRQDYWKYINQDDKNRKFRKSL